MNTIHKRLSLSSNTKYRMRNFLLIVCIIAYSQFGMAQSRVITGKVTSPSDPDGLPGVNVVVKGTTNGTTTDVEGKYSIKVENSEIVLVYSFIGYTPKEITVGNQSIIDVELQEEISRLEEVVVIGFGTTSRKLLTSTITKVKAEDLENSVTGNLNGALQGKAAGVQIIQNSGTPGAGITVNVRGLSSISAGNQPLYVIDGVPMLTGDLSQIGFEGQGLDAIADLNPNDIESIEILKDASAAAIYGTRAANGVVLITTKSGGNEKTKFSFNAYHGIQETWNRLDLLNGPQFMEYINETEGREVYSATDIANAVSTDWQDEIFRTTKKRAFILQLLISIRREL